MRRFFNKKTAFALVFLAAAVFVLPLFAHAQTGGVGSTIIGGVDKLVTTAMNTLFEFILLPTAAMVMALAGLMMDIAINFSIHTSYIFAMSPAINLGWVIVRDIANIFFIFILIYISLGTIVKGTGFGTKQLLTQLIIAALLVNFSMFFTKAIIDVSNVFGNWLYGGIQNSLVANSANSNEPISLSALIADRLGVMQYWAAGQVADSTSGTERSIAAAIGGTGGLIAAIIRFIIVLLTTYIFGYVAVLFMARAVELLILLVFSPIGFVGKLLPQTSKYSNEWWHEIMAVAIFPIAFLLMLYISLQFINGFGLLQEQLRGSGADVKIAGFPLMTYFQYFIVIFLLKACLKIAKENAGEVGDMVKGVAEGLGKMAVNAGIGIASGGTSLAMRTGAAAIFAEKGKRGDAALNTFRSGVPILNRFGTGKSLWGDVKKDLKGGSYDIRNAKIPGGKTTVADVLGSGTGVKINTKSAKEYSDEKKNFDKEIRLESSTLSVLEEIKKIEKAKADFASGTIDQQELNRSINASQGNMRSKIAKMSNQDIEALTARAHGMTKDMAKDHPFGATHGDIFSAYTGALKHNQTAHIAASDMPGAIKDAVMAARLNDVSYALAPGVTHTVNRATSVKQSFMKLSPHEVSKLPLNSLTDPDVLPLLKSEHLKKIMDEYAYDQRDGIRSYFMGNNVPEDHPIKKWLNENTEGQLF